MILSIIIPTYNEEEYLPVLLDSIKEQSFTDYEIIVADANSEDRTREIAEEYGCIVIDGGMPAVGRNNGAKIAKGEYLLFLDSDLKLTDEYLQDVIYEFRMERLGIGITQMEPLSEKTEDKILHELANTFMIAVENIKPHGAGCYGIIAKKELHDKCGGFNEELSFGEDTDYIERLAKEERFKVLRRAKVGVSTRRLEEEGFEQLIRQYGKSTLNDFRGKRTDAEELEYSFEHKHHSDSPKKSKLDKISLESERLMNIKEAYNKSKKKIEILSKNRDNEEKKENEKKIIFYCVCGEGMGHAIRSATIINEIKERYNIYIFSSDRAYKYLKEKFPHTYKIGGFNTVYKNNKAKEIKTLTKAIKDNPKNLKQGYENIYRKAKKLKPSVFVTDFEIYGNIVANMLDIPLIALDNIHMITQTKIDYPQHETAAMLVAKAVIKAYVYKPKIYILTSFFYPKIRSKKHAVLYPPVLRKEILELKPKIGDYILVYQTSKENMALMEKLKILNEKFIVYGFNKDETDENLTFRNFNEDQFFQDLANAKAVVSNGGFTFITESIALKKPIFSVPAQGNFEQILNGFYVQKLGYGEFHKYMDVAKLATFLKRLPKYQEKLNTVKTYDNTGIINELIYRIEKYSKN